MPFLKLGNWGDRFNQADFVQARNIRGGTITSQEIIIGGGTNGVIRSENFDPSADPLEGWAIFGDGSATFGGDVIIGADLYSSNWDGTIPADLSSNFDTGATAGYYLDHSAGTVQFMGNVYIGGGLVTGLSGDDQYIEIDATDIGTLRFVTTETTAAGVPVSGDIWMTDTGGAPVLHISGTASGASELAYADFYSAKLDIGTGISTRMRFYNDGTNDVIETSGFYNDPPFRTGDGTASIPVYSFVNDVDSGFYLPTSAVVAGVIGGNERMRMTAAGLLTDYSDNNLPRTWYENFGSFNTTATSTWETIGSAWSKSITTNYAISLTVVAAVSVAQTTSATHANMRIRVQTSIDGGTTWISGPAMRVDDLSNDEHAREVVTAMAGRENVSPTGNVQVRVQIYTTATTVVAEQCTAVINVVGDF